MVKKFRPRTPGTRGLILPSNKELTRVGNKTVRPTRRLLKASKSQAGRNNLGRITCRHRGGGHKHHYRMIDFRRDKENIPARVASVEYDPNRSAHIALLNYADGEKRYILAPKGLREGNTVATQDSPPYKPGYCMRLKAIPLGSIVHNIELYPGRGGKLVRAAGLGAQLMARSDGQATIKMPSGEVRLINEECRATLGEVSNGEHGLTRLAKAGRNRWKGIRPTVRGTAMNPVDHPHGGGEGRHNGYIPRSPWAMQTKGFKTRKRSKSTAHIVKSRKSKR